jgi:hypothetical protein
MGPIGPTGTEGQMGQKGDQGPAGGPTGSQGTEGPTGAVSLFKDFSIFNIKFRSVAGITTVPQNINGPNSTGSEIAGYAIVYSSDNSKILNNISVSVDNNTSPTQLTFTLSISGSSVNESYISTSGFGHNVDPKSSIGNTSVSIPFVDNVEYTEYVTSGAIYSLNIKWN